MQKLSNAQREKHFTLMDPKLSKLRRKKRGAKSVRPNGKAIQRDGILPSARMFINHKTNYSPSTWAEGAYPPFGINNSSPQGRNAGTAG